jgi:RNA polymerase sigma factor (TIGR02999 family)
MPLLYPELRRIARQHLEHRPPGHTLESAALANEAYLKLVRARGIRCENRVHFLALCSQIIRRILVDHARGLGYAKRGGGATRVPLDEALLGAQARGIEMVALDEALEALSKLDPRKGRVVELRYFGGLSVEATAAVLGISPGDRSAIGRWPKCGCSASWPKGRRSRLGRRNESILALR